MAEKKQRKPITRKNVYTICEEAGASQVQIADDVVAAIVALAATEVEGVASMGGGVTHEKAAKAGARALAKGVQVDVLEKVISIRAVLNMRYGYNIPETCKKVQAKVKEAVEEMTGLEVADVAVSVADVTVEKTPKKTAKKK